MSEQRITIQPGDSIIIISPKSTTQPPVDPPPIEPPPTQPPSIPGNVHVYELQWANTPNIPMEDLPKGDILALKTTTGDKSSVVSLPFFAASEYNSQPRTRVACLSYTPGDFDNPVGGAPGASMQGKSITAKFAVGSGSGSGYYPVVPLRTTVYCNIKTIEDDDDRSRQMFASLNVNQL